ncbi:MAG: DUF4160 domain-containing protein [Proteobacteria bacterium]|jgi:Domain of unknown function (DUF4160)|nr:DUF4160 domain-containing protein [Pseudomonadota bacterium]
MPTIVWIRNIRIVIYLNDHRPAHVHAIRGDEFSVFELNCPDGPLELREAYGFSGTELKRIADAIATQLTLLCLKWRTIHGTY